MTFTKKQAAEFLNVSTRTIDKWCAARLLPFHLVGTRKRFTDADLRAYLDARAFGHRSDLSAPQGQSNA
jgi:excisionase family DNA binding protein